MRTEGEEAKGIEDGDEKGKRKHTGMVLQRSLPIRSLDLVGCCIALETKDLVRVDGGWFFDVGEVMFVMIIFARVGRGFRGFSARTWHCDLKIYNRVSQVHGFCNSGDAM